MEIFWEIVEDLNWDGNYVRCKEFLMEKYSKEDIKKLENTFNNLFKDLHTRFEQDWLDSIEVGDDGWLDLRSEVIGRGKEFFENITVDKLIKMGEEEDYHESFMYVFPNESDYKEQPEPPSYPEHEKMKVVNDKSQIIGEFLENCGYTLCEIIDNNFIPTHKSIEKILAEYFKIDLNKIGEEKRQMIKAMQEMNS